MNFATNPQEEASVDLGSALDRVFVEASVPWRDDEVSDLQRIVERGYRAFAQRRGWREDEFGWNWCQKEGRKNRGAE